MLVACGREDTSSLAEASRLPEGEIHHGMIQLGEKLDDPYTVENMRQALAKVYPTRAARLDIAATDLYVRFLPQDDAEMKTLQSLGIPLLDHPMDYSIVREGDYYQDPEIGDGGITWQYSVVGKDFEFPEGIRHEVLDECFISEHDPVTRSALGSDVDWEAVEREAFRLTGNESMVSRGTGPVTRGAKAAPEGRITIVDPQYAGGKPIGVSGVTVVCNVFVKIAQCFTDREGYYKMGKTFSAKPRYRLMFKNSAGFSIGLNMVIVPASVSTLGKGGPEGIDYTIDQSGDAALFRRGVVNNAAYDYYARCTETDLGIAPPPGDLRIWIFPRLACSSACMLHHGALLDNAILAKYLGEYTSLIKIFLPDVTLGLKNHQGYSAIYSDVMHELSHASHYAQVGNSYWTPYICYVIQSFLTEGGDAYGSGNGNGAGACEVGEMWAYFMEASLYRDRYQTQWFDLSSGSTWIKPAILSHLLLHGMSRGEIFRALTPQSNSSEALKNTLCGLYPERETLIRQGFGQYGK